MDNCGGYDAWRKISPLATPFDFDQAVSVKPKGHCVAVRVTSEDPDDGFKPTSGKVLVNDTYYFNFYLIYILNGFHCSSISGVELQEQAQCMGVLLCKGILNLFNVLVF